MANYRYLGYGITNEQGIATLDHDANGDPITHSYTGTGAGEIDVVASLDDSTHISDSSMQSEIYAIIDGTFKDIATTGKKNSNWTNLNNNIQETVEDDYTVLKSTVASSQNRYSVPTSVIPSAPFVVEFKKHNVPLANVFVLIGSRSFQLASVYSGRLADATLLKFTVDNGEITVEHDGTVESIKYEYTTMNNISFQFNSSDLELWYKDFIIYPI